MKTYTKSIEWLDAWEYKDNPAMWRTIPNWMKDMTTVTEFDLIVEYYWMIKTHKQLEDGTIRSYITQDTILNCIWMTDVTICKVNYRPVKVNTFDVIEEYLEITNPWSFREQYMSVEIPRQEKIKEQKEEEARRLQDEKDRIAQEEQKKIENDKKKEEQYDIMMQNMMMMQQLLLNNQQNNVNNWWTFKDWNTTVTSSISSKETRLTKWSRK